MPVIQPLIRKRDPVLVPKPTVFVRTILQVVEPAKHMFSGHSTEQVFGTYAASGNGQSLQLAPTSSSRIQAGSQQSTKNEDRLMT